MLSRLISLLSRIPAVKWAVTRLRPLPHGGSIDVTPIADESPAVIAEAAPALDSISVEPQHRDVEVAARLISSDPPAELLANVEPDVVEEVPVSSVEIEIQNGAIRTPEAVVSSDPSPELPADVEPVVAEQIFIAPDETETTPVEASELVIEDEPATPVSVEIEPAAVGETPATAIDEISAHVEPAPASPAPKSPRALKARAKIVEPADRATLIRQRWAETGIRMWNPRLHGTGDATLNIQGRIELLPPEPGETMPRYDKLEFRMLGRQIVCEGVIIEAPVLASQRSFTRLAEPRGAERTREPVRERQAALA